MNIFINPKTKTMSYLGNHIDDSFLHFSVGTNNYDTVWTNSANSNQFNKKIKNIGIYDDNNDGCLYDYFSSAQSALSNLQVSYSWYE